MDLKLNVSKKGLSTTEEVINEEYTLRYGHIFRGPKGDSGEKGEKGETGAKGDNGKSPKISDNGTWLVYSDELKTFVDTGIKASGSDNNYTDADKALVQTIPTMQDVVLAKTFLTADNQDYNTFVKELYIYPQFIDADFVVAKCYSGGFYIRPQIEKGIAKYTWQAVIWLNELSVDNVYDIITTVEGVGNIPIGTKVGYIVFSDIVNLSQINDERYGEELNISVISSLTYSPIIVSSIIFEQGLTNEKMNYEVYSSLPVSSIVYKDTIEDLWIDAQYLVDANKVNVRYYYGDIIIRAYQDSTTLWTFRQNIKSVKNGELYPIVVDEDIIGYIIFKDIDQFRSYSSVLNSEVVNLNLVSLPLSSRFHSPINIALSKLNKIEDKVDILLPSTINCVVGDELRIYYKSIVKATNASSYNVKVVSAVGKAYPKYYVLKASTIGTHTATFSITDNNGADIAVKNTTINVVSAMSAPTTQKNVLVFGASATASGHLAGELKRRLTETSGNGTSQNPTGLGLDNIVFVGRKQGTSVAVNQEATGGWSWGNYAGEGQAAYRFYVSGVNQLNINDTYTSSGITFTITEINVTSGSGNIRCTYTGSGTIPANGTLTRATGNGDVSIIYTSYTEESFNPFWNNGKLDFVNYANKYCDGSIDIIISHCGMNDMGLYTVDNMANLFTNYIKPFVRAYHRDFPNGKVIISTLPLPSPTGGMGANYGASATWNWQTLSLKLWEFARLCEEMCKETEFSAYVYMADCIPTFDCETSYPYEEKSVNTRSTVTEHIGSNGVHPTKEGSYQVSDAIYSIFNVINK